jgi:hypothetical protein
MKPAVAKISRYTLGLALVVAPATAGSYALGASPGSGQHLAAQAHTPKSAARQPARRRRPGALLNEVRKLPPEQREARLRQDPDFQRLPPERQQQMLDNLRRFNAMPPQRQEQVLARMRYIESLSPQQRQNLQQVFADWRNLPPERRRPLRQAFNRLRQLPPDQREAELKNLDSDPQFSSDDRALLRRTLDFNIPPEVFGGSAESKSDGNNQQ